MKYVVSMILIVLVLSGCGATTKHGNSTTKGTGQATTLQNTAKSDQVARNASHLEQLAEKVPGVQHANCVVVGNYAIVGIDVDPSLDRSKVGTLKYSVAEALKKDPLGVNAVVTADMDLSQRIKELGNRMRSGQALSGVTDEVANIMGRIMPQIPRDINSVSPDERNGGQANPDLQPTKSK